jgi:transposase
MVGECGRALRLHKPETTPQPKRPKLLSAILGRLDGAPGTVARLARGLVERCLLLSTEILNLDKELEQLVQQMAPTLLEVCGCATLNAAKILGETADVRWFRSRHAYARHEGTAPLPGFVAGTCPKT